MSESERSRAHAQRFSRHYMDLLVALEAAAGGTGPNDCGEEEKVFLDSSLLPEEEWGGARDTPEVAKVFEMTRSGRRPGDEDVVQARLDVIRAVDVPGLARRATKEAGGIDENRISGKARRKQVPSLEEGYRAVRDSLVWAARGVRPARDFGEEIMPAVLCMPGARYPPARQRQREMREKRGEITAMLEGLFPGMEGAGFGEFMGRYNESFVVGGRVADVYGEMLLEFLRAAKERIPFVPSEAEIVVKVLPADSTQMGSFDYRPGYRGYSRIRPDPESSLARIHALTKHEFTHFLLCALKEALYMERLEEGVNDTMLGTGTMCSYIVTAEEGAGDCFDQLFAEPLGVGPETWDIPPELCVLEAGLSELRGMYTTDCSLRMLKEKPEFGSQKELEAYIMEVVGIPSWARTRSLAYFDPFRYPKAALYHPLYRMNEKIVAEAIGAHGSEHVLRAFREFPVGAPILADACMELERSW